MSNYPTTYSESWKGQDGREWREVSYWVGRGYQTFLQVKVNGEWRGWQKQNSAAAPEGAKAASP